MNILVPAVGFICLKCKDKVAVTVVTTVRHFLRGGLSGWTTSEVPSQHHFEKQTVLSVDKFKKKSPFWWGEVTGGNFGKHSREEAFLAWLEKNRESMVSTYHNNETCVSKQV